MKVELSSGDPGLTTLVRLARQELRGEPSRRDDASFAKVTARLAAQRQGRAPTSGGRSALLAAAAVVLLVGAVLWLTLPARALTYRVDNGETSSDRIIGGSGTRVRFSDGSELALEPGAEARIEELAASGGRLRVERGGTRVNIAKKPGAAWSVAAGPYTIEVTGTAFDVRWSGGEQRFELAMHSGSVVVKGPLTGTGLPLRAGQRLVGGVSEGRLTLDDGVVVAPSAVEPAVAATSVAPSAPSARPAPKVDGNRARSWSQQVALGQFNAVLDDAEQRGLERTLSTGSLEDLSALADAARYGRRTQIARRALLAQRQRFPGSPPARDAAFFLARLGEEHGSSAQEWYDRYLQESPGGAYVAQALGRKMMLSHDARGSAAARPLARDYLQRYPNGSYAAAARKIMAEPAP